MGQKWKIFPKIISTAYMIVLILPYIYVLKTLPKSTACPRYGTSKLVRRPFSRYIENALTRYWMDESPSNFFC